MKKPRCRTTSEPCRRNDWKITFVVLIASTTVMFNINGSHGFVLFNNVQPMKRPTKFYTDAWLKSNVAVVVPPTIVSQSMILRESVRDNALKSPTTRHSAALVAMMGMWSQNDEIEGSDRIKACIPYLLPLIDGDHFGQYIYERVPIMGSIDQITIGPLADLGRSIPFLSLGLFLVLTLGTRFNTTMSRNLRFSAQQAALIDVALLIPELIGSGFVEDPLPRYIAEPCCNFVWYAYMSVVIYCVVSNLRGKKPDQIPYLSNAADLMVGPF